MTRWRSYEKGPPCWTAPEALKREVIDLRRWWWGRDNGHGHLIIIMRTMWAVIQALQFTSDKSAKGPIIVGGFGFSCLSFS